jgi:site-specific DNA-methyltransferase (adenine-specific)
MGDRVKPYYERDGITIYHGDCREILPSLKADVVVTDPPYGVAFKGKATKHTKASGGYTTEDSAVVGPDTIRLALPLVERAAVFTGTRLAFRYPPPADIGCVYCPSGAGIGTWGFTCMHIVLFYGPRPTAACKPSSIQSFDVAGKSGHPCPKPLSWMKWLVNLASIEGETILDPFMGSGTTLVAAKLEGRKAIGIEIEERYCEIAAKRLAQGVLNFQ